MNITLTIYTVVLFVLLTPGILVRLPPTGNKWTVAFVHGLLFALIFYFTQRYVWALSSVMEGMDTPTYYSDDKCMTADKNGKYKKDTKGNCVKK